MHIASRLAVKRVYGANASVSRKFSSTSSTSAPIAQAAPKRDKVFGENSLISVLDESIVGQGSAKKKFAIAVMDRFRRLGIKDPVIKKAAVPPNILLVGPTGCGKTELARCAAKVISAPFIKCIATRYTEVGFVGDDTTTMVEDLADRAYLDEWEKELKNVMVDATARAKLEVRKAIESEHEREYDEHLRAKIDAGELDDTSISIDAARLASEPRPPRLPPKGPFPGNDVGDDSSAAPMVSTSVGRPNRMRTNMKLLPVGIARQQIANFYANQMIQLRERDIKERAKKAAEETGVVFIDEFDKIISDGTDDHSFGSKRRGVQKELLTLLEGCEVNTPRLGPISTDHVLFICSGAFHTVKPSNIMPELLGRLPVSSTMEHLCKEHYLAILKLPTGMPQVQVRLMESSGVTLVFTPDAYDEIAQTVYDMNRYMSNIGARRIATVVTEVMEGLKMKSDELYSQTVYVDRAMVQASVSHLLKKPDHSKHVM